MNKKYFSVFSIIWLITYLLIRRETLVYPRTRKLGQLIRGPWQNFAEEQNSRKQKSLSMKSSQKIEPIKWSYLAASNAPYTISRTSSPTASFSPEIKLSMKN